MEDITPQDIEDTITLLENLSDTDYFQNSSITFGMIEALQNLNNELNSMYISEKADTRQEALNLLLDG